MDGFGYTAFCFVSLIFKHKRSSADSIRALSAKSNLISALTGVSHEKLQVYPNPTCGSDITVLRDEDIPSMVKLRDVRPRADSHIPVYRLPYSQRRHG